MSQRGTQASDEILYAMGIVTPEGGRAQRMAMQEVRMAEIVRHLRSLETDRALDPERQTRVEAALKAAVDASKGTGR